MQMQRNYESTNPKIRADKARTAARELDRKGFHDLARVNWEMAEWLDPTPREETERAPRRTSPMRFPVNQSKPSDGMDEETTPMTKRAHRASNRPSRSTPRGTSVVSNGSGGRVLRQSDRRAA